jgi:hypothetical protein
MNKPKGFKFIFAPTIIAAIKTMIYCVEALIPPARDLPSTIATQLIGTVKSL